MGYCRNCQTKIGSNEWFCNYCGELRSDCIECGGKILNDACKSCSAAPAVPCEQCGAEIRADRRECPECGYDAGQEYEEKAEKNSIPKLLTVGGGLVVLFVVGGGLISILKGMIGGGILGTLFSGFMWLIVIVTAIAWVVLGGSVAVLSDSWAGFRQSQAERATAGSTERAVKRHRSQEYVEEQRKQRERKERKKKEQRHRTLVQCPDCGLHTEVVVEGQVTDVQADTNSGALGTVNSALDTIGSDTSKDCAHCGTTLYVSSELR